MRTCGYRPKAGPQSAARSTAKRVLFEHLRRSGDFADDIVCRLSASNLPIVQPDVCEICARIFRPRDWPLTRLHTSRFVPQGTFRYGEACPRQHQVIEYPCRSLLGADAASQRATTIDGQYAPGPRRVAPQLPQVPFSTLLPYRYFIIPSISYTMKDTEHSAYVLHTSASDPHRNQKLEAML